MAWDIDRNNFKRQQKPPMDPRAIIVVLVIAIIVVIAYRTGHIGKGSLYYYAMIIPSIILHEISHGWLANLFGDPTAKNAGRLTLNPVRHVDPVGTFILPGLLLLSNTGFVFGYAKPVPVNTTHMSRNKSMLVGLVGPFTNIVLAVIAAGAIHLAWSNSDSQVLLQCLIYLGLGNIALAVFNLIPIPPLDGASVVERFLPAKYLLQYLNLRQYAMIGLLLIMLVFQGVLLQVIQPFQSLWAHLLPPLLQQFLNL